MQKINQISPHPSTEGEYMDLGIKWLLDHHKAKEGIRHQMVNDLDIQVSDKVLDLGCGVGLWSFMMADKVGNEGKVTGLDFNDDFVDYAVIILQNKAQYKEIVDFVKGDFLSVPFEDNSFDISFCGNCFAYVTEYQKFIEEQKRVVKKGGRIAIKDFQGSVLVIHPINPLLTLKVMTATAQSLENNPPNPSFDNFSAQKL